MFTAGRGSYGTQAPTPGKPCNGSQRPLAQLGVPEGVRHSGRHTRPAPSFTQALPGRQSFEYVQDAPFSTAPAGTHTGPLLGEG